MSFTDKNNWNLIERGYVFDAATFYQSDGKQPLTFFEPDSDGSDRGRLVSGYEAFKPVRVGDRLVAVEHQAVIRLKPRKVVVLSHNTLNQSIEYDYVHIAPINSIQASDKGKKWFQSLLDDEHILFVNYPSSNGYERFIDVSQVTSIHKGLLIKRREQLPQDRLELLEERLLDLYELGTVEEVPNEAFEDASNQ